MLKDDVPRQLQRLLGACDGDKGIAIAITADPRTKSDHAWQLARLELRAELLIQRSNNLLVNLGHSSDQTGAIIVQSHLDLIADRRRAPSDFVGARISHRTGTAKKTGSIRSR